MSKYKTDQALFDLLQSGQKREDAVKTKVKKERRHQTRMFILGIIAIVTAVILKLTAKV